MKRSLTLVLLLLVAVLSASEDFAVRKAWKLGFKGHALKCADQSIIVLYEGSGAGNTDIYAQKFTAEGEALWADAKIIASGAGTQKPVKTVNTSDNHHILLYQSLSPGAEPHYYLQKLDADGNLLWNEDGVEIQISETYLAKIELVPNQAGGAFVIYNGQYTIYSNNTDTGGNLLYPGSGHLLFESADFSRSFSAFADGAGGLLIAAGLTHYHPQVHFKTELYRYAADYTPLGPAPLLAPEAFPTPHYSVFIDALGRVVLFADGLYDLYLQRIDMDGNLEFDQAISYDFSYLNGEPYAAQGKRLAALADGGLMICRFDYTYAEDYFVNVRTIRLDNDLQHLWEPDGVIAVTLDFGNIPAWAEMKVSETDKTWFAWIESGDWGEESHFKVQMVDENGNPNWDESGKTLAGAVNPSQHIYLKESSDGALCVFGDLNGSLISLKREYISNSGSQSWEGGESFVSHMGGQATGARVNAIGGGYFCYWNDSRNTNNQIYYQLYDENFAEQCEPNGRSFVDDGSLETLVSGSVMMPDGSLAFILFVREDTELECSLYLQKVSPAGDLIYPKPGLLLTSEIDFFPYFFGAPRPCLYQEAEDIYVAWQQGDIRGQKITDGALQWGEWGKTLVAITDTMNNPQLRAYKGGYLLFDFIDEPYDIRTWLTKFNTAGEIDPAWSAGPIELFESQPNIDLNHYRVIHTRLLDGDLIVFAQNSYSSDVLPLMQIVYPDGTQKWDSPGLGLDFGMIYLLKDREDGFLLMSQENYTTKQYFLNKIDLEGQILFAGSEPIFEAASDSFRPSVEIVQFDNGAIYCLWTDLPWPDALNHEVFYRKISPDGEPAGPMEVFCDQWLDLSRVRAYSIGNSALVVWSDARHDSWPYIDDVMSVYARRLDAFPISNEDEYVAAPQVTCLHQNYPNPFNPETTISFDLAEVGEVELSIYNMKGQLVRKLVRDQKLAAGMHSYEWDGKDESGQIVSSGIYLYKLQSGRYSHSKKMIMLK